MPLYRLAGLCAVCLLLGLVLWLRSLEPNVVALQFAFTPAAFGQIIHAWSPDQLERYRIHLPIDGLLALAYGAFGHGWVAASPLFAGLSSAARSGVRWLLPLAALADLGENAWHAWLTAAPRFGVPAAYGIAGLCATLKWLLVLGFVLVVARRLWRQ